jgi:hypothetical protein
MLRAVFARTLKPGVTDEDFIRAWLPPRPDYGLLPRRVCISHNINDQRQIISIFEVDSTPQDFPELLASLVHPDSAARLGEIVESTQFEAVFEDTATFGSRRPHSEAAQ